MQLADLMTDLTKRWPRHADEAELRAWMPTWRDTVGRFQGRVLADGWALLCAEWTRTTPPKPGDVKAACERVQARQHRVAHGPDRPDDSHATRCLHIEAEWCRQNAEYVERAKAEGWWLPLKDWIRDGAGILAQREDKRERGKPLAPLSPDWPWLSDWNGEEAIIRPPAERVEMWRQAASARVPAGGLRASAA